MAAVQEEFMPKAVLKQFLGILREHFTAKDPISNKLMNPITEYQRRELSIQEHEWRAILGDPVSQPYSFSGSSDSSDVDYDDGDDWDSQLDHSEEQKQPMLNQVQFFTGFIGVAEDLLPRMSESLRRFVIRVVCNTLEVGPKLRRRFNIQRV